MTTSLVFLQCPLPAPESGNPLAGPNLGTPSLARIWEPPRWPESRHPSLAPYTHNVTSSYKTYSKERLKTLQRLAMSTMEEERPLHSLEQERLDQERFEPEMQRAERLKLGRLSELSSQVRQHLIIYEQAPREGTYITPTIRTDFDTISSRLNSFKNWRESFNPWHLALSGFYHDTNSNHPAAVICFCCNALWRFGGSSGQCSNEAVHAGLLRFHTPNCMYSMKLLIPLNFSRTFLKISLINIIRYWIWCLGW